MKILYLYNRVKSGSLEKISSGAENDNHLFGMLRLPKFGVDADYIELEKFFPEKFSLFLRRKILNIHFAHLPLFPLIFVYDIVFTSTAFGCLLIKSLLKMIGIKRTKWVIFDFNMAGSIGRRKIFKEKLFYFMNKMADGIITISKDEEQAMQAMFPEKKENISFIHLGTDTDFFKPVEKIEEDFILSVGRDPGRDFGVLIEAMKDLNIKLKLTARPSQLKKFEPLPDFVSLHDFSTHELVEQYAKAKLVVITLNIKDGQENDSMGCSTLVEAMSMGRAVIATDTTTMASYIVSGENGLLVPKNNPQALREAILDLINNNDKRVRLADNARNFVVDNCAADIFAQNLASFFRKFKK